MERDGGTVYHGCGIDVARESKGHCKCEGVCVCVCMTVYMYESMRVCVYILECVHECVCVSVCIIHL